MKTTSFAVALAFLAQGAARTVPVASHDDLQSHFSSADTDGDGKLDLTELTLRLKAAEFIHGPGREAHMAHEAELDKQFEDDTRGMTKDAFKASQSTWGWPAEQFIKKADTDGDGKLSRMELEAAHKNGIVPADVSSVLHGGEL
jgi:Ca2+-binding EF-hand superfamily protein